jgi:hypothetical protein
MDCLSRDVGIRQAVQQGLSATQRGADDIVSLLDDCSLLLALDVATIQEAQGSSPPADGCWRPMAALDHWDKSIGAVQERLQVARDAIARLKSENLRLKQELTWQLP